MADTHVKGLADLQKMLDQLPAKMEANIMRSALRAGAQVVKEKSQQNLQRNGSIETGKLREGLKVSTSLKRGRVTASVKAKGPHGYLAHWIEFGVKPHSILKGARRDKGKLQDGDLHPGFNAAPFMRPALDSQSGKALLAVGEQIKKRLTKQGINTADIDLELEE